MWKGSLVVTNPQRSLSHSGVPLSSTDHLSIFHLIVFVLRPSPLLSCFTLTTFINLLPAKAGICFLQKRSDKPIVHYLHITEWGPDHSLKESEYQTSADRQKHDSKLMLKLHIRM